MSGAEIASFLLAGPPILVSWLEHYREVFEMLGCWKRFRNEYRKAETQLQALDLSFDLTLEKLFLPHVESLDKLQRLKSNWKDELSTEADENLRQRLLPEVYSVYANLFKDLQDAMSDLEKTLGYDKEKFRLELKAKVPNANNQQKLSITTKMQLRSIYELERVKFSVREKPREAAIRNVEHILEKIQRLLDQNDEVATKRANHVASSKAAAAQSVLLHFWRHARAVYDLLAQTWSCGCRRWHCADLLLFHRAASDVTLDFWFRYALPLPERCPWGVLPAQICKAEPPSAPKPATKVRFAVVRGPQSGQTAALSPINDLCRTFTVVKSGKRAVGLLSGQDYESDYSLTKLEHTINPDTITLGSLLRLNTWERPQRKQRYRIAATIASTHLQLHSSGWLKEGWNKDEIHFLTTSGQPDLDRLYLRTGFHGAQTKANAASFDIAFATLGILLLELCFGFALEESPFRRKYLLPDGSSDLVQDRMAAWEWSEKVAGEADERWAHAIDWCLSKWKVRESDSTWRQDFYQAVVEPLRAEATPL